MNISETIEINKSLSINEILTIVFLGFIRSNKDLYTIEAKKMIEIIIIFKYHQNLKFSK